jgi:hypothetical protein
MIVLVLRLLKRCMGSPHRWDVAMLYWVVGDGHFDTQRAGLIFKVRNAFIQ